jgi:hypothetical protein
MYVCRSMFYSSPGDHSVVVITRLVLIRSDGPAGHLNLRIGLGYECGRSSDGNIPSSEMQRRRRVQISRKPYAEHPPIHRRNFWPTSRHANDGHAHMTTWRSQRGRRVLSGTGTRRPTSHDPSRSSPTTNCSSIVPVHYRSGARTARHGGDAKQARTTGPRRHAAVTL